jgi:hypothetical protein
VHLQLEGVVDEVVVEVDLVAEVGAEVDLGAEVAVEVDLGAVAEAGSAAEVVDSEVLEEVDSGGEADDITSHV